MWLVIVIAFLGLVAVVGGAFAGGIFTIVLIPLAIIGFVVALGYTYFSGTAQRAARGERGRARPSAPPTSQRAASAPAPTTPEQLADARRANQ